VPIIYNFTVEPTTRTRFDPVSPDNINWHVADYVAAHYNFAMLPETERYWPTPELDKYIVWAIDHGQAWRARVPLLHAVCKPSDASWFWNWTAFKPTSEHSSRSRADYRALCDELVRERGLRYANVEDGVRCDLRERIECAHYEPEHSHTATSIYEAYLHHDPLGLLPCVIARYDTLQAAAGWWWSKGCLERPGHYATLRDAALVQLDMLKQQQQQQQQKRSDAPDAAAAVSPTKRAK
jgi:hypothetical protein